MLLVFAHFCHFVHYNSYGSAILSLSNCDAKEVSWMQGGQTSQS